MGGWVQVSLGNFFGKSSQISPKPVLIFWSSIPCVFCLYYRLLKVVVYYDFSVLSMSVMGFHQNLCGWVGQLHPIFWEFLNFFNFHRPQSLSIHYFVLCNNIVSLFFQFFFIDILF